MRKGIKIIILLAAAICLLSLTSLAASADNAQNAEDAIVAAIGNMDSYVDLSEFHVSTDTVVSIFNRMYSEHPELFYYQNRSIMYDPSTNIVSGANLIYNPTLANQTAVQKFNAAVDAALSVVDDGMSTAQKVMALHDYLADTVAYDTAVFYLDAVPLADGTAYGALVDKLAVCSGYSYAYKVLLDRLGIPCIYVSSVKMNHGWNQVQIDGKWYHVDVTWDDSLTTVPDLVYHDFLLVSDQTIAQISDADGMTHSGWSSPYKCTDTSYENYFWKGVAHTIYSEASDSWVLRSSGEYTSQVLTLSVYHWATGKETVLGTAKDYWREWGTSAYYNFAFSDLEYRNGILFFNDSLHIYGCNPLTGEFATLFTYSGGQGYLYDVEIISDKLCYILAKSPNEQAFTYYEADVSQSALVKNAKPADPGLSNFDRKNTYTAGLFSDVAEAWYTPYVKQSYELGLMKGSDGKFNVAGNVTLAETITLAARIHMIYHKGTANFVQGTPWYEVYADYCLANGIISAKDLDYNRPATRAEFASILSRALPESALTAMNHVADGAIPDVKASDSFCGAVYLFYRAGILTGSDAKGTFNPSSNIVRTEVAAIVTRMVDPSLRKSVTLG